MRNSKRLIPAVFVALFLLVILTGCDGFFSEDKELSDQVVLFQYEYVNHAWGYFHNGWLIDSFGVVHCYRQPESWNFPDSSGYLDEVSMQENLYLADSICYTVNEDDLNDKSALVPGASGGEISLPENVMADAGISGYYAYIFEHEHHRYSRILLKEEGDWERENLSNNAKELYKWLEEINIEVAGN